MCQRIVMRICLLFLTVIVNAQSPQATSFDSLINASILLSEEALYSAEFAQAEKYVDAMFYKQFKPFQVTHDLKLLLQYHRIQIFKSIVLKKDYDWHEVVALLSELKPVAKTIQDKTVVRDYYSLLASSYRATENTDSATCFEDVALKQYEASGDLKKIAQWRGGRLSRRHLRLQNTGNFEAVIKLIPEYEKEIEFARNSRNKYVFAYNTRHLAQIHRQHTHDYEEALRLFEMSLNLRKDIGFKVFLPASYSSIGDVSMKLGQRMRAIEVYLESILIADEIGFVRYQIDPRIKLGDIYKEAGKFTESRNYYIEALKVSSRNGYESGFDAAMQKLEELANLSYRR